MQGGRSLAGLVFFFRKWKTYATTANKEVPSTETKATNQSSKQEAKDNLELEMNVGVDPKQTWEDLSLGPQQAAQSWALWKNDRKNKSLPIEKVRKTMWDIFIKHVKENVTVK